MSDKSALPRYSIPNLANACQIMKLLATDSQPQGISAIARRVDVPRTTVLRIVSTLVHESLLRETATGFVLGPGLVSLGLRALENIDLRRASAPILRRLSDETDETTHLAIPADGFKSLLVEVAQSPHPIRVGAPAGTLVDLYCSSTGKVFTAWLFADRLPELLANAKPRTPNTIITPAAMKSECARIRKQGYAVDEEEFAEGLRCLAVPVYDNTGTVAAAIGITGPANRLTRAKVATFAAKATEAARLLSHELGGK